MDFPNLPIPRSHFVRRYPEFSGYKFNPLNKSLWIAWNVSEMGLKLNQVSSLHQSLFVAYPTTLLA